MLADKYLELLTAYVDGELSARRQRMVQKLLRKSPEARALLHKLQQDSHDLMELPPPPVPDVSLSVMQAISQRGLALSPRIHRLPATVPLWKALAAAAAVLILAAGSTYLFFTHRGENGRSGPLARNRDRQTDTKPADTHKVTPGPVETSIVRKTTDEKKTLETPPKQTRTEVVKNTTTRPEKPPIKPEPEEVFPTAPSMGVFNPHEAEVSLPTLLRLADLPNPATRQSLIKELGRHDSFYLEVLCREATHALPRLQAVLQAAGHTVIVDGPAQLRLKQPQFRTNYLLYMENATPEEIAAILLSLGQEDLKADKKKPAYGQFLSNDPNLVVCPLSAEHRQRLIAHLGVDPRQAKGNGPLGVDLTRPLSEQTVDRLGGPRPDPKATKPSERSALVLMHGNLTRAPSAEVKRFLDGRKPARKGAIQVMLVLRARPQ